VLNNWIRVLRLIWSTGRGGVLGILVSTTIDALVPAAQVVLLGLTVNAVLNAADAADLLIYPLLFGLVACFGLILTTLQSYWQASLEQKVSNTFNLKLMEKSGELSLPDFENPKVYNMLQLATREATSRPYQLFSQLVATVSGGISLVTVTGIVVTWNPLVALLILLSPVLPVLVNQLFVKRLWQVERNRSEERRRGQYLLALVTNDKTYKETRLFGLVPHFINAYRQMLGRFYSVDMEIERKRGVAGILSGLLVAWRLNSFTVWWDNEAWRTNQPRPCRFVMVTKRYLRRWCVQAPQPQGQRSGRGSCCWPPRESRMR